MPDAAGRQRDGCVITGRLSRLNGGVEQVLIEDWCQQYPSHSIGWLAFGNDGALYVSGGDGASFNFADYGQDGMPLNPCGDPPAGVGGALTPPTAEGGALRSQDVRTPADPTGLDGAILRVNPDTGAAMAGNPDASADPNARRIVAYGLRNPFRITVRPGTNEVWAGDVGWHAGRRSTASQPDGAVRNFGWPCYEGTGAGDYDALDLSLCEKLYSQGAARTRRRTTRTTTVARRRGRDVRRRVLVDLRRGLHAAGQSFPPAYDGALFFSDYSRDCIWAMLPAATGCPTRNIQTFVAGAPNPVELQFGPGGDLYYVDIDGGTIRRVRSLDHQPRAGRARDGDAVERRRAAHRGLRRPRLERPRRPGDHLRLGPRRRRRLRRLDAISPELHLHGRGHLHRAAARPRSRRPVGHGQRADHRRQPAGAGDHHHLPGAGHDVEGRRHDRLQRHGDRLPAHRSRQAA